VREPAACVLSDGIDAQLGENGNDAEQCPSHRSRGVNVRLGKAFDVHATLVQLVDGLDSHCLAACDPVESADNEGVTGTQTVQASEPLRTFSDAARLAVVDEHARHAARSQLSLLGVRVLIAFGHSCVTHDAAHPRRPALTLGQ
jgi:hypothetical protein